MSQGKQEPHNDVAAFYARHAKRFDSKRSRLLMELPYLEQATALAPPPGTVLDIGCGTGEPLARYFTEKGYRVTGIDAANEMLEMCRARFPDMTWHHADMRQMNLPEKFNLLIAWDSFFHLTPHDQREMFPIFHKHTAPGGVLIFTSGPGGEGEVIGELWGDPLYHASLDTPEFARLLELHGYRVVLHRVEDPNCGGHTVWIAQMGSTD